VGEGGDWEGGRLSGHYVSWVKTKQASKYLKEGEWVHVGGGGGREGR